MYVYIGVSIYKHVCINKYIWLCNMLQISKKKGVVHASANTDQCTSVECSLAEKRQEKNVKRAEKNNHLKTRHAMCKSIITTPI